MTIPSLDLDPQRTKLQLLVMQTEAFVKDPVNVVVKEKHFVVKNFYATLVKAARANFMDAKNQAERWMQAVTLPLEVQIRDHKAQLQSRVDNLAKINEKTTTINEQMALLKAAEADLRSQREMIEGLIARVSAHASTSMLQEDPADEEEQRAQVPAELMQTTRLATFNAPPPAPRPAAPPPEPAQPLVSDDLMAQLATPTPAATPPAPAAAPPGFDPMKTQKLPANADRTQKIAPQGAEQTQRLPTGAPEQTQRLPTGAPEQTQRLPAAAPSFNPEATQPIDDSVWRLEEARRILKGVERK
jgi:hypothetical protein